MRAKAVVVTRDRLESAVRLGAFLLVWLSAIALYSTEKLRGSSLLLLAISMIAWLIAKKPSRSNWWDFAAFVYLFFFFFDWFRLSASLAPALVHLFIFIIVNKIFNLHTQRDYYQLYLLTFLSILAASSLNIEVEMFYIILAFIILMIWNMVAITLMKEWKRSGATGAFPFSLYGIGYWSVVLATAAVALAASMLIFFILPRMQFGFFANLNSGQTQHVSGFSSTVGLGDVGKIADNPDVAMRVRIVTPVSQDTPFYWRGIAFDYYDGKSWSRSNQATRFLYQDSSDFFYTHQYSRADEHLLVKQEFYLVPLDTRVIFGLDRITKVRGSFVGVSRDSNGTLTAMNRTEHYTVYSRLQNRFAENLRRADIRMPDSIKQHYLQLPKYSPQMEALARIITGNRSSVYEQVKAMEKYLRENYEYSTSDLPQDPRDPVSEFLFEKKKGHCEFFATGMVLLLRHIGIPARLVNGFLQGEYNDLGDFYIIRHGDAHSWVEVNLNGTWISFDPSPRAAPAGFSSWFSWFNPRKIAESITFFWDRYILIFSAQDQWNALSSARDKYDQLKQEVQKQSKQSPDRLFAYLVEYWKHYNRLLLAGIALILLFVFAQRWILRKRLQRKIARTPVLFYDRMLSILEQKGFARSPELTPAEFLSRISLTVPDMYGTDVALLTDYFYKSRFGNYILTTDEQTQVHSILKRLERM